MLDMHLLTFESTTAERFHGGCIGRTDSGISRGGGQVTAGTAQDSCGHRLSRDELYLPETTMTTTTNSSDLLMMDTYTEQLVDTSHQYGNGFYPPRAVTELASGSGQVVTLPSIDTNYFVDESVDSDMWVSDDEDDFGDDDYEEEEHQSEADSPEQLLNFVQKATQTIQSVFSRNKGADDYCDIYEERFKSALSGREMYYRDLLALASGGDSEPTVRSRRKRCRSPGHGRAATRHPEVVVVAAAERTEHTFVYDPASGEAKLWKLPHYGRLMGDYGLGPLEELFCRSETAWTVDEPTTSGYYTLQRMPMTKRKLPNSFWQEPGSEHKVGEGSAVYSSDFTDIFPSWVTMQQN